MVVQRIFGFLYLIAGIAKAFPQIEDVPKILVAAHVANQGTMVEGLSFWIAENAIAMNIFVGIALAASGLALLFNTKGIKLVIYAQMIMMVGFIVILWRSQPQVIALDAIFMAAAIYMLRVHNKINVSDAIQLKAKGFEQPSQSSINAQQSIQDHYDVVIIGGGVSGLTAAFELNNPVLLLEKSAVFGGNARFEQEQGLKHPTAGVCFQAPVKGTPMVSLLSKLGLDNQWKDTGPDTIVFFDTNLLMKAIGEVTIAILKHPAELLKLSVWKSTSTLILNWIVGKPFVVSPKSVGDPIFADLFNFLENFSRESGQFPEMPYQEGDGMARDLMEQLDAISLYSYLFEPQKHQDLPKSIRPQKKFGQLVENAIETTLRVECLSIHDVSAYVGIHFLIGYLKGTLVTLPGGNGSVSSKLLSALDKKDNVHLINNVDVTRIDDNATITFLSHSETYQVKANQIVWAAPKHSFHHVYSSIPSEQKKAMQQIAHHDYCLANVMLEKSVLDAYFGGYAIEPYDASRPLEWVKTGVCLVPHWMDDSFHKNVGVLSLLKPIALKQDQGKLAKADFKTLQQQTYKEIASLLAAKGIDASLIRDIKLWAWPKGLVVSTKGQQASRVFEKASQPIPLIAADATCGQVVFANQDSIGIGNIESAVKAAFMAVEQINHFSQRQKAQKTTASEQINS
ncbi:MAG: DUF6041 domain-containing protein [Cellvibrionales bacterium]|nr:DUF6041 domain-containing protein [Cellvibrionales bacterium]